MKTQDSIKRLYRPLPFFGIDFILTWFPLWLMVTGLRSGWFAEGTGLLVVAGLSSTFAAVLFVYRTRSRDFIRDFWIRAIDPFRIRPVFWAVLLLSQLVINITAILLSSLGGGSLEQLTLSQRFLSAPLGFVVFIFIFGPLPEELGWRGYGLDALRSRMNLLKASLLLGLIWGVWHLPLVFIPGSFQNSLLETPFVLGAFFIAFFPSSIIMSWIYYHSGRSTLSAILFHFAGNFSGELLNLSPETRIIQMLLLYLWAVIVLRKEWPMFSTKEFWIELSSQHTKKNRSTSSSGKNRRGYIGTMFTLAALLSIPLFFISTPSYAESSIEACAESRGNADTSWETVPLPYIFYTSDTGIAGGATMSLIRTQSKNSLRENTALRDKTSSQKNTNSRDSHQTEREDISLRVSSTWTEKNQKELNLSGEKKRIFGNLLGVSHFRYSDYPSEFFGLGPESGDAEAYTSETLEFDISLLKNLNISQKADSSFRLGPIFRFSICRLSDFSSAGELAHLSKEAGFTGLFPGAGVLLRFDSRTNPRSPNSGSLLELQPLVFFNAEKSRPNFFQLKADMRTYLPIGEEVTLALRYSATLNSSDPPLHEMGELGGLFLLRGYPEARYIDRNAMAGQMEVRFPLYKRLGGVVFAAAGTVAPSPGDFRYDSLKPSAGAGLRFSLNSSGDINLRIDYGLTGQSSGLYITLMEAF